MDQTSTNTSIINTLVELGLGQNEAIMYEILLKNPDATIPVLTKSSQFSRTMLYYVINNLIAMELANSSKNGKKTVYNAAPPEKLEDFLHDQEKELERQKNALKGIIPDLGSIYRLANNKPGIRFFEGLEGIKLALEDSLSATEPILTYMDMESMDETMREANDIYVKKRLKLKRMKRLLVVDSPRNRELTSNYDKEFTEVRFLPRGLSAFRAGTQIYNNKVAFFSHRNKNIISIIIDDQDLYDMNKNMFDFFWASAGTVPVISAGTTFLKP